VFNLQVTCRISVLYQCLTERSNVRESDKKPILLADWRAGDNTDCAARMHEGVLRALHFNQRYDLGARKYVVQLVGHWPGRIVESGTSIRVGKIDCRTLTHF